MWIPVCGTYLVYVHTSKKINTITTLNQNLYTLHFTFLHVFTIKVIPIMLLFNKAHNNKRNALLRINEIGKPVPEEQIWRESFLNFRKPKHRKLLAIYLFVTNWTSILSSIAVMLRIITNLINKVEAILDDWSWFNCSFTLTAFPYRRYEFP